MGYLEILDRKLTRAHCAAPVCSRWALSMMQCSTARGRSASASRWVTSKLTAESPPGEFDQRYASLPLTPELHSSVQYRL
jgi:hypothetical protein